MGAVIESWPKPPEPSANKKQPTVLNSALSDLKPTFNTFVLNINSNDGIIMEKVYGACIMFYERFDPACLKLRSQLDMLQTGAAAGRRVSSASSTNADDSASAAQLNLHSNKCLLILSRNPLFDTYRFFLDFLLRKYTYKLASSLSSPDFLPLER